jgi:hypothetical protein
MIGMYDFLVILGKSKRPEAVVKNSLWVNGLNTHQSPEFQGFNPSWMDESFMSLFERKEAKTVARKKCQAKNIF